MPTCKDCIHFKICNDYEYLIGREDKVACTDFKSTEDVVPRSEAEEAKQEVARKIFEEIEKYLQPNEDWAFEMKRQNQDCSEEYWGGKLSAFKQIRGFIDVNLKKKYIGE